MPTSAGRLPFQHPEAPALNASIPLAERLFGQGARATFANVVVTVEDRTTPSTGRRRHDAESERADER